VQKSYTASGTFISENSAGGSVDDYYEFRPGGTSAGNLAGALITSINNQKDTFLYVIPSPDTISVLTSLFEPDNYTFDSKFEKNITIVSTTPYSIGGTGAYTKTYINMRKQ
jgi:hypothetical protein